MTFISQIALALTVAGFRDVQLAFRKMKPVVDGVRDLKGAEKSVWRTHANR